MTRLAAGFLGLLLLAGCGIPAQDQPVNVAPADLPSPLRGDGTPRPSVPATIDPDEATVLIYFVRSDRLVGVPRAAPDGSADDRLRAALTALATGPSEAEQARGVTTAFPPGITLDVAAVQGRRAVLTLNGETDSRSAVDNILTVGQVVLSLTSLPAIHDVSFVRDGVPVEALLPGGALSSAPLTAADYGKLKAP